MGRHDGDAPERSLEHRLAAEVVALPRFPASRHASDQYAKRGALRKYGIGLRRRQKLHYFGIGDDSCRYHAGGLQGKELSAKARLFLESAFKATSDSRHSVGTLALR